MQIQYLEGHDNEEKMKYTSIIANNVVKAMKDLIKNVNLSDPALSLTSLVC